MCCVAQVLRYCLVYFSLFLTELTRRHRLSVIYADPRRLLVTGPCLSLSQGGNLLSLAIRHLNSHPLFDALPITVAAGFRAVVQFDEISWIGYHDLDDLGESAGEGAGGGAFAVRERRRRQRRALREVLSDLRGGRGRRPRRDRHRESDRRRRRTRGRRKTSSSEVGSVVEEERAEDEEEEETEEWADSGDHTEKGKKKTKRVEGKREEIEVSDEEEEEEDEEGVDEEKERIGRSRKTSGPPSSGEEDADSDEEEEDDEDEGEEEEERSDVLGGFGESGESSCVYNNLLFLSCLPLPLQHFLRSVIDQVALQPIRNVLQEFYEKEDDEDPNPEEVLDVPRALLTTAPSSRVLSRLHDYVTDLWFNANDPLSQFPNSTSLARSANANTATVQDGQAQLGRTHSGRLVQIELRNSLQHDIATPNTRDEDDEEEAEGERKKQRRKKKPTLTLFGHILLCLGDPRYLLARKQKSLAFSSSLSRKDEQA